MPTIKYQFKSTILKLRYCISKDTVNRLKDKAQTGNTYNCQITSIQII